MHETEKKVSDICALKDQLISCMKVALSHGYEKINAQEAGEVADMIKDLAEAEEKCWKACYYKSIVGAMEEAELGSDGVHGYNPRRYSSGRYAPAGKGHISGYLPGPTDMKYEGHEMMEHSNPYDNYRSARRHYTESGSTHDKTTMDNAIMSTISEIWADADPMLRDRLKKEVFGI